VQNTIWILFVYRPVVNCGDYLLSIKKAPAGRRTKNSGGFEPTLGIVSSCKQYFWLHRMSIVKEDYVDIISIKKPLSGKSCRWNHVTGAMCKKHLMVNIMSFSLFENRAWNCFSYRGKHYGKYALLEKAPCLKGREIGAGGSRLMAFLLLWADIKHPSCGIGEARAKSSSTC
jgi:hypothetical protein